MLLKKIFTVTFDDPETMAKAPSGREIVHVCMDIATMLVEKNKAYGDSALNPLRVFSKANAAEQIRVRMDDKLSRLVRGEAAGEDAILDLVGYYVLLRVAELRENHEAAKEAGGVYPRPAVASHCLLCRQTFTGSLEDHECPVKDRVNHPG